MNRWPTKLAAVVTAFSLLAVFCSRNNRENVPLPEFANLYAQLILVAATQATNDSLVVALQDSVLRVHGLTRERFSHLLDRYVQDPRAWLTVTRHTLAVLDSVAQVQEHKTTHPVPRKKPRAFHTSPTRSKRPSPDRSVQDN